MKPEAASNEKKVQPGVTLYTHAVKIAIATTQEEVGACFPIIRQLRPHLDAAAFAHAVARMRPQGYQLAFVADPDVRAVAGFRKMELLVTGPVLYVDDLVTAADYRSQGYGRRLVDWLLAEAKRQGCQYLELDSGLQRVDAHRFYERHGFVRTSFHYSLPALAQRARVPPPI